MFFVDCEGNNKSIKDIINLIDNENNYELFIGTDSKINRKKKIVHYVTCIVLYKKGKGGRVFIKNKRSVNCSLKERLSNEVWKSIEVAIRANDLLIDKLNVDLFVHLDVNSSTKYKSGAYHQELAAMVSGQGLKFKLKPDAWAASSVSDRVCKRGVL